MFSCTHTHTRTYKLRCLSTRCIKKWNLFFLTDHFNLKYDSTVAFWPFVARHVPSGLAACHICSSFTKFTTLHTRLTRRMCALCTRRVDRPCVCVCVCIWQGRRLHDRQLRVHYFICTLCLSAFQTFIFRCTWLPLPPLSVLSSTNYS